MFSKPGITRHIKLLSKTNCKKMDFPPIRKKLI